MLPFKRSATFGYTCNAFLFLMACLASIAPRLFFGYKLMPYEVSEVSSMDQIKYSNYRFMTFPDQYIHVYIIGIVIGYLLRNGPTLNKVVKTNSMRTLIAIVCVLISFSGIAWSENFREFNKPQNKVNLFVWFVSAKVLWMTGNVWFICLIESYKNGN